MVSDVSLKRPRGFTTIGLTPGCPAGVGPELLAMAIAELAAEGAFKKTVRLRFFASAALFVEGCVRAGVDASRTGDVVSVGAAGGGVDVACVVADADDAGVRARAGVVTDAAIDGQRDALLRAIVAATRGDIHALVTGPVRKAALLVSGVQYPGQTELVHKSLHDDDGPPLMVFSGAPFLLGLQTVHMPLSAVSSSITTDGVIRSITRVAQASRALLKVEVPHIVVLGLNPHAGEGGLLGHEDDAVIAPAVKAFADDDNVVVTGPVPADGFFADVARAKRGFARHRRGKSTMRSVHGVVAMHHDQGLGPYKLLSGGDGVNITWGLRVPRTSPDHGTADALAGQGIADPSSTKAAVRAALKLARP
jgi:4-hydroxythreonine-4-phosphate dehydrogenase